MPVIARRTFLRIASGAACYSLPALAQSRSTRWALLSDTHISAERDSEVRSFVPWKNLERATRHIVETKPDGCLITGDLARLQGTPGDYVQLKAGLAGVLKQMPVGLCLGNHDDRENFFAAFPGPDMPLVKDKHVAVIQAGPVRMIVLDSLIVPNETPGYLGKAQRTWLERYLASSDATPTLLCVHHTLDDEDGSLLDSDRLLRIAAKHAKVKAIFYGHSHRHWHETYEGMHLVNLPALAYSFNERQPVGWIDAVLRADGAELTLRAIAGNTANDGKSQSLTWRG